MKEPELSVHCSTENSDPSWHVDGSALKDLVERICHSLAAEIHGIRGVRHAVAVSCYFVDAVEMRRLNLQHRNIDAATDMLSFPIGYPAPGRGWVLGDVVICMDVVEAKGSASGNTTADQLAFSLIHSFLHLLGFDHMNEPDRARMEQREELLFAAVEAVPHAAVARRSR